MPRAKVPRKRKSNGAASNGGKQKNNNSTQEAIGIGGDKGPINGNVAPSKSRPNNTNVQSRTRSRRSQVISLDVTYSSSDLDISDEEEVVDEYVPETPLKPRFERDPFSDTFSPDQIAQRGIMSDSDSDDLSLDVKLDTPSLPVKPDTPLKRSLRKAKVKVSQDIDSDSDLDLYAVSVPKPILNEDVLKVERLNNSSDDDDDDIDVPKRLKHSFESDGDIEQIESSDDDLNLTLQLKNSPVVPQHLKIRCNRKTQQVLSRVENSAISAAKKSSLSQESDVEVLSDDPEDNIMTVRLFWAGKENIRMDMNKKDKFVTLYQRLAKQHGVSVGDIYLTFENTNIDPNTRPEDLSLSIVDVIEGGIKSKLPITRSSPRKNKDPNLISLKVQNANRKDSVFITIHKMDNMTILMSKYSDIKKISLSKLKFHFDGEGLDPTETPQTLELDGGEIIDVYDLS